MNKYQTMDEFYKACGDAIRNKKNTTAPVSKKEIPNEILSIPTNEALVVDSLDESLLIKENVGKLYECGGKLYKIVGKGITSLQGATIEFNEELNNSLEGHYEYSGEEYGSSIIDGQDLTNENGNETLIYYHTQIYENVVYNFMFGIQRDFVLNEKEMCVGYYYYYSDLPTPVGGTKKGWTYFSSNYTDGTDETIESSPPTISNFDFPQLNEKQDFVEWILNNAKVSNVNYESYVFEELEVKPQEEYFLTFSSKTPFSLEFGGYSSADESPTLEYSTDKTNWHVLDMTDEGICEIINSSADGKLYMRGIGNTSMYGGAFYSVSPTNGTDLDDFRFDCTGNIETLLDYQTVMRGEHPQMDAGCFAGLFGGTNIVNPPELPAMQLSEACYQMMFTYCRYLEKVPELPATMLANNCYYGMFQNCWSLTVTPKLPATILAPLCYYEMFMNCINLSSISEITITQFEGAYGCFPNMYNGCVNIKLYADNSNSPLPSDAFHSYRVPKNDIDVNNSQSLNINAMFLNTGGDVKQIEPNKVYYTTNIIR